MRFYCYALGDFAAAFGGVARNATISQKIAVGKNKLRVRATIDFGR
jgi:hypothetical protein